MSPRPGSFSAEKTQLTSETIAARRTSNLEDKIRKPLAAEKTEVMIREIPRLEDIRGRPSHTLEMALEDHSEAAAKDPAPPESKNLKSSEPPSRRSNEEDTAELEADGSRKGIGDVPRSAGKTLRPETTDGTSVTEGDEDDDLRAAGMKRGGLEVPMSSVLAVSAAWVLGLVAFFFVGRVSGFKSAGNQPTAQDGIVDIFQAPGVVPPLDLPAATAPSVGEPKPCWVIRQPRRWAESASKSVPFEMLARDGSMDLGFALDDKKASILRIDPKAGTTETVVTRDAESDISRVSPLTTSDGFYVSEEADRTFLPVSGASPFYLALEKSSIGVAETPGGTVEPLWALEGDDPITAEQILSVGDSYLLTFRRGNDVYGGYVGADKKAKGELSIVSDKASDARNGKPRSGTNGTEVAVVYAVETTQKVKDEDTKVWRIHIARGLANAVPTASSELQLPPNGPGGDAIAPDVIGLKDGRWLLMWTEGNSGARAIRAQTYDASFQAIGDPIALSPPAGSFGQAVLGVMNTYTTVAFLQAADDGFEMWGAVLQCGI